MNGNAIDRFVIDGGKEALARCHVVDDGRLALLGSSGLLFVDLFCIEIVNCREERVDVVPRRELGNIAATRDYEVRVLGAFLEQLSRSSIHRFVRAIAQGRSRIDIAVRKTIGGNMRHHFRHVDGVAKMESGSTGLDDAVDGV